MSNIETIKAGGGDDLIDMTSNNYNYDVGLTAYSDAGNDTIWATKHSDTIYGGEGNVPSSVVQAMMRSMVELDPIPLSLP